jgi:phenol hydroxylase P1 protein
MSVDISAKIIEPIRKTYSNVSRRIGDKPASRYQEATFDIQPEENFHYRPTWAPEYERFDKSRTAIVMEDWYSFKDPRQFYYGAYTMARAKQQESMDKSFSTAEKRGLVASFSDEVKQEINNIMLPLRHFEWGANMNNCFITDFGYGTAITQLTMFYTLDRLAVAQYLTRLGLLVSENDVAVLDAAKDDWLNKDAWQGLRHAVEDTFVIEDWFETMIAQNIIMDSVIYELIYQQLVNKLAANGAGTLVMLTEFMSDLQADTTRWSNALVKVTAAESDANKDLLSKWASTWLNRITEAMAPLAKDALGSGSDAALKTIKTNITANLNKQGLSITA